MNRIKVTICGKEYSLKTAENASYVLNLAAELESKINNMVNSGNGVSIQTAAILIALSAMDDANKANQSVDNIRTQIKQYVDEAAKAMLERDEAIKDKESLKSKLSGLENDLKIQKIAGDVSRKADEYLNKKS
ncbi:MAG: cell division protein ZapA [Oscillospiraceae bacterium]|nr:cell division protein ZapA [Oscillospiraceae bacterium]